MVEKQVASFSPTYREFQLEQTVYFMSNNPRMDKWVKGKIARKLGDLHYAVEYDGKHFKRHVDQIRSFEPKDKSTPSVRENQHTVTEKRIRFSSSAPVVNPQREPPEDVTNLPPAVEQEPPIVQDVAQPVEEAAATTSRYEPRQRNRPERLSPNPKNKTYSSRK